MLNEFLKCDEKKIFLHNIHENVHMAIKEELNHCFLYIVPHPCSTVLFDLAQTCSTFVSGQTSIVWKDLKTFIKFQLY